MIEAWDEIIQCTELRQTSEALLDNKKSPALIMKTESTKSVDKCCYY